MLENKFCRSRSTARIIRYLVIWFVSVRDIIVRTQVRDIAITVNAELLPLCYHKPFASSKILLIKSWCKVFLSTCLRAYNIGIQVKLKAGRKISHRKIKNCGETTRGIITGRKRIVRSTLWRRNLWFINELKLTDYYQMDHWWVTHRNTLPYLHL